jgi:hypothetical protein
LLPRDRGKQPYNVEITELSEKAFEAIAAKWPLVIDALDALWTRFEQAPHDAGVALPHMDGGEFFVSQTSATTGRPSIRVLYEIESNEGRVIIHHIVLAQTA